MNSNNINYLAYTKKILLFIVIFIFIDRGIGFLISTISENNLTDKRIKNIITGKINSDLVVIGSSRAARNINAATIEEYSGMSSYNLGRPGSNIDYHNFLLKSLIEFCEIPKYILLVVDPAVIKPAPSLSFRYDLIYQLSNTAYIKNVLVERGQLDGFLTEISSTYSMKHAFLESFKPHRFILGRNPLFQFDSSGSMNLPYKPNVNIEFSSNQGIYSQENESFELKEDFLEFIQLCKTNHITLLFVLTPNYGLPMLGLEERLLALSRSSIQILDYRDIEVLKNSFFYNDGVHLNANGAKKLSELIASDMKKIDKKSAD